VTPEPRSSWKSRDPHEPERPAHPSRARVIVITALALLAFASNSILCLLALSRAEIDPATFTTIRLVSGAAVLSPLAAIRTGGWTAGGNWASAVALAVYAVAFSYAYVSLDAGVGALLLFGAVQATMIVAAVSGGESTSRREWAGLAAALTGLLYLVLPGLSAPPLFGAALMLAAGAAWGAYTLLGRRGAAPVLATAGNFARSSPLVLAVSAGVALGGGTPRATPVGIALALASGVLASGFGYVLWYAALRHLTAVRAATVQLVVPVLGAIGGILLLGESFSQRLTIASLLILGGVGVAVARPRPVVARGSA
jgi:drug/metabolite transporter (DMT)-like permease